MSAVDDKSSSASSSSSSADLDTLQQELEEFSVSAVPNNSVHHAEPSSSRHLHLHQQPVAERLTFVHEDSLRHAFQYLEFLTAPFKPRSRDSVRFGAYALWHGKLAVWVDITTTSHDPSQTTVLGAANDETKMCLSPDGRALALASRDNTIQVFLEGKLLHKFSVRVNQYPDGVCIYQLFPTFETGGQEYSIVFSVAGVAYRAVVGGTYRMEKLPIDYGVGLSVAVAPKQELIWHITISDASKTSITSRYSLNTVETKTVQAHGYVLVAVTTSGEPLGRIDLTSVRTAKNLRVLVTEQGDAIVISRSDQPTDASNLMTKTVITFALYSARTFERMWIVNWNLTSTQLVYPRFLQCEDGLVAHTRLMASELKSHATHYATLYPLSSPLEMDMRVYQTPQPVWVVYDVALRAPSLLSFTKYFQAHMTQQIPLLKQEVTKQEPSAPVSRVQETKTAAKPVSSTKPGFVPANPSDLHNKAAESLAAQLQRSRATRRDKVTGSRQPKNPPSRSVQFDTNVDKSATAKKDKEEEEEEADDDEVTRALSGSNVPSQPEDS